ncbi:hypothetical protein HGRIS_004739 [Hohenbuehelia grisea]|uniref:RNA polymerase-associated protein LEO1 n=1 Tax=Hohenbuehelia grisea TaxID=104357 RepID=A0ABR3JEG6_9AGAR
MSSLAGALIPPEQMSFSNANHSSHQQDDDYGDVQMNQDLAEHPPRDEDADGEEDEEMADLFGNDDDVENAIPKEDDEASASAPDSERLATPEREHRRALEYEEDDIPGELAVEVKEANVAFPNIPVPKSSDGENWVIRMPNFVKVDSKPYHPDTYMGPEHEDEEFQQAETLREKSMSIKLKVENTVRWRWIKDENGIDQRQANSRIIRWSDGSLSLRLGKELFDINQSIDTSGAVPRSSIGGSQSQPSQSQAHASPNPGLKSQGLTYLVAQHKRAQVLQSEAVVTGYMSLRPTGMQSETHRMLVRAVGQKHNKVARLRLAPDPTRDPEKELQEIAKQNAKKSRRRTDAEDGFGGGHKRRNARKRAAAEWSDDEDDDLGAGIFDPSEGEDDEGGAARASSHKNKKKIGEEDDRKADYQEDGFVVADEDDDEDSDDPARKRRRRDDMMEDDPLEKMEAQLEQQDARKRRHKRGGDEDAETADEDAVGDAMDVESEEEEDEHKVRRPTRRKAAAVEEEEEEEDE